MRIQHLLFFGTLLLMAGCAPLIKGTPMYVALEYDLKQSRDSARQALMVKEESIADLKQQNQVLQHEVDSLTALGGGLSANDRALPDSTAKEEPPSAPLIIPKIDRVQEETDDINNLAIKAVYKDKDGSIPFTAYVVHDPQYIRMFWRDGRKRTMRNFDNLKKWVEKEEKSTLLFAMNAGMYDDYLRPQGLYIEDRKELRPLDKKIDGFGNFYLQPNGVFLIDTAGMARVVKTSAFEEYQGSARFATQSGPMLVHNDTINTHFREGSDNLHIRNGVGVDDQNRIVFVISDKRINLHSFALIFQKHFNCKNALYLDGAVSKMYLPLLNRKSLGGTFGPMLGVAVE